jgi:hypothetical protein
MGAWECVLNPHAGTAIGDSIADHCHFVLTVHDVNWQ